MNVLSMVDNLLERKKKYSHRYCIDLATMMLSRHQSCQLSTFRAKFSTFFSFSAKLLCLGSVVFFFFFKLISDLFSVKISAFEQFYYKEKYREVQVIKKKYLPKSELSLECMKHYPSYHIVSIFPECDSPIV